MFNPGSLDLIEQRNHKQQEHYQALPEMHHHQCSKDFRKNQEAANLLPQAFIDLFKGFGCCFCPLKLSLFVLSGDVVRAAQSAPLEQERLQRLKEIEEMNQTLIDVSNQERHIGRLIRQIRGTRENVGVKASELVKISNNPLCPHLVSSVAFAKKVVSHCRSPDDTAFACAHVFVLVTSQAPRAMDLLLAEFHRACIYTVPKHIEYSKSVFESK